MKGLSPPTRSFDKRKFVSALAVDKYEYFTPKVLTTERGLRPDSFDVQMRCQINEQGWDTFTDQPDPTVVIVVKEFYANVDDKA